MSLRMLNLVKNWNIYDNIVKVDIFDMYFRKIMITQSNPKCFFYIYKCILEVYIKTIAIQS